MYYCSFQLCFLCGSLSLLENNRWRLRHTKGTEQPVILTILFLNHFYKEKLVYYSLSTYSNTLTNPINSISIPTKPTLSFNNYNCWHTYFNLISKHTDTLSETKHPILMRHLYKIPTNHFSCIQQNNYI